MSGDIASGNPAMKYGSPSTQNGPDDQNNPKTYAKLAQERMRNGRHEEAIAILKLGLSAFQNHGELLYDLSRVLVISGRLDEAVAYLEKSLRELSDKLNAFKLLASIYKSQGRHDEAVAVYRIFLAHEKLQEIFARRDVAPEHPGIKATDETAFAENQSQSVDDSKRESLSKKNTVLTKMIKLRQSIEQR